MSDDPDNKLSGIQKQPTKPDTDDPLCLVMVARIDKQGQILDRRCIQMPQSFLSRTSTPTTTDQRYNGLTDERTGQDEVA